MVEEIDQISKTRKIYKKADQKILDLLVQPSENAECDYFPERYNYIGGQKIKKIGFTPEMIFSNPDYTPKPSSLPPFYHRFGNVEKILSKRVVVEKVKEKNDNNDDLQNFKKIEHQQYVSTRFGLIERAKQLSVFKGTFYKTMPSLDMNNSSLYKSSPEGMTPAEIKILQSRSVKMRFEESFEEGMKIQRYFSKLETDKNSKRLGAHCAKFVEKKVEKNIRLLKDYTSRARTMNKEAISFWRKREKELNELKKRELKLEQDKKKKQEEQKEAELQQKRLAFLMTQSDIYSHFMAQKLGIQNSNDVQVMQDPKLDKFSKVTAINNSRALLDDEEEDEARANVSRMINNQRRHKEMYDDRKFEVKNKRQRGAPKIVLKEELPSIDPEEDAKKDRVTKDQLKQGYQSLDFSDVQLAKSSNLVQCPSYFSGTLKKYQLKGLRWLDNLFDQGINGILADEMGLGKTIQAIALLSHLASKGNWGPFLVVAPNSTLMNWRNEINKFFPKANVVPYWSNAALRKIIRKFFDQSSLGNEDSRMHVTITSYNMAVQDFKVFHRVRWQYIILDEAQAIKNNNSQRWTTLLSFKSRNKLLLTGTPIQNSMTELWALLHFIMPQLFDSLDQFKEWFSKDIESSSEDKKKINQIQLNKLHAILKPFMLRRVKKDVEKEIGKKTEYKILCQMSRRQKGMYSSLRNKLSMNRFFDLVENNRNLLNLVMQLRKVCNHPEIFERRQFQSSFSFYNPDQDLRQIPKSLAHQGMILTNWENPISLELPRLVYHECFNVFKFNHRRSLMNTFDIYSPLNVRNNSASQNGKGFCFVDLMGMSGSEYHSLLNEDLIYSYLSLYHKNRFLGRRKYHQNLQRLLFQEGEDGDDKMVIEANGGQINGQEQNLSSKISPSCSSSSLDIRIGDCFAYYGYKSDPITLRAPKSMNKMKKIISYRNKIVECYLPSASSLPVSFVCRDERFTFQHQHLLHHPLFNYTFYGSNKRYPHKNWLFSSSIQSFLHERVPRFRKNMHYPGLLGKNLKDHFKERITVPGFKKLITDSGKLRKLHEMLPRLKREGHRVLIFCQMTKMLNILEEYLLKMNMLYFRLDGNTSVSDRDYMVKQYQTNESMFAFILSTRAGGIGVTLTAADTVIFYDNDWNPTIDAQATDRAHRIGQMKDVSVYR